jgi:hypothetical protein
VLVFAWLSLHHLYPSQATFTLVALGSGRVTGLSIFKTLWIGISEDWITEAVIVLTVLFTIVLPMAQLPLQWPSLYVGALVFGALAIGIFREKIPATAESSLDEIL